MACGLCRTPHHQDCWDYLGRCGLFGCGGIHAVPFQEGTGPPSLPMVIDEATRPPLAIRLRGWVQQVERRSREVVAPVGAGVAGAFLVLVGFAGYQLSLGFALGAGFHQLVGMVLAAGVLHGLATPLLASLQHRYPRECMGASLVAAGSLVALLNALRPQGLPQTLMVALIMAGFLTFSTSAGEWLFGRYSRIGRRARGLALPLRVAATWAAFVGVCAAVPLVLNGSLPGALLNQILLWSLLAVAVAAPSLEVGRERYHKHLIALAEAPQE